MIACHVWDCGGNYHVARGDGLGSGIALDEGYPEQPQPNELASKTMAARFPTSLTNSFKKYDAEN